MKFDTFTYIEVQNLEGYWAVDIDDCKQEMKPIRPKFVLVSNCYYESGDVAYIDHQLTNEKPARIIDGVNGGIADNYKEVGFWKIKH
jgi:hypothetical protein